ncbi:MAG TPA: hypothetical protein VF285_00890 [Castellaniella sp.]|uniref:hypothetical protein n=1 Tax=Castellaniella sp. TaxID=1955812 RepID=UPI002F234DF5
MLTDSLGQAWQAALLDASYGSVALLFSPLRGSDIRCYEMPADTMAQAEAQLAAMTEADLLGLLAEAQPWTPG